MDNSETANISRAVDAEKRRVAKAARLARSQEHYIARQRKADAAQHLADAARVYAEGMAEVARLKAEASRIYSETMAEVARLKAIAKQ